MAAVHPGALATGALQKEEEEEEPNILLGLCSGYTYASHNKTMVKS
jgi:hypothetical protein